MTYDVKIYDGEEEETIRDLKYSQMVAVTAVLFRHKINHTAKNLETGEVKSCSFGKISDKQVSFK